jgi:hypothetical protein
VVVQPVERLGVIGQFEQRQVGRAVAAARIEQGQGRRQRPFQYARQRNLLLVGARAAHPGAIERLDADERRAQAGQVAVAARVQFTPERAMERRRPALVLAADGPPGVDERPPLPEGNGVGVGGVEGVVEEGQE